MKTVFLDRDGVISIYTPHDFIKNWDEFAFLPAARGGLKLLSDAGFRIVVVSNQSGVNKGIFSEAALCDITDRMRAALAADGVFLAGVYYCTHREDEQCDCRKPRPGMLFRAARELGDVNLADSFFIGDTQADIEAGKNAGARTILVLSGKTKTADETEGWPVRPDFIAADLEEAARIVIARSPGGQ